METFKNFTIIYNNVALDRQIEMLLRKGIIICMTPWRNWKRKWTHFGYMQFLVYVDIWRWRWMKCWSSQIYLFLLTSSTSPVISWPNFCFIIVGKQNGTWRSIKPKKKKQLHGEAPLLQPPLSWSNQKALFAFVSL